MMGHWVVYYIALVLLYPPSRSQYYTKYTLTRPFYFYVQLSVRADVGAMLNEFLVCCNR